MSFRAFEFSLAEDDVHVFREEEMSEAVIEFWNVIGQPIFHLKTIPLGVDGAQSLLWIEDSDSLLAAHMDGSITVHHTHSPKFFVSF